MFWAKAAFDMAKAASVIAPVAKTTLGHNRVLVECVKI
jgi:hypothetical protein